MTPQAEAIWSGLTFRTPMMLRHVEPLDEQQMHWEPGPDRVSIAWQLWHIAEVEDNWIRQQVTHEPLRFPFGVQLREANAEQFPARDALITYFKDVRAVTRQRLEVANAASFSVRVDDPDYGEMTTLDVWLGVVTSFAWHAGQIALTAKLLPQTPVTTMPFGPWQEKS